MVIHFYIIGQFFAEAAYIVMSHLQCFDRTEGILDVLITTRKACKSPDVFRCLLLDNINKRLKIINRTQHACIPVELRQDQRASMLDEVFAKLQEIWTIFECHRRFPSRLRRAALEATYENYSLFHIIEAMSQHLPRAIIASAGQDEEETITAVISDERKMKKIWFRFYRPHYEWKGDKFVLRHSTSEFMIERCQLHHLEQSKKLSPDDYSRVTGVSHIICCSILDFV